MQELWVTATVHHHANRFKMDNKKYIVNLESFRDMLHICPRVHGQSFAEPPFEEEILAFIHFLGHSAPIRTLTDVNIYKLCKNPNLRSEHIKGLVVPRGRSYGGNGRSCGDNGEVSWLEEVTVDWPSIRLIRTMVEVDEDWLFLEREEVLDGRIGVGRGEVKGGGVDFRLEAIVVDRVEMQDEDSQSNMLGH
nr:hypothetical protein [Tanacetum cinerariifolium]